MNVTSAAAEQGAASIPQPFGSVGVEVIPNGEFIHRCAIWADHASVDVGRAVSAESVSEGVSDVDLIDVMGEATRDESMAIAQRLAAVAELFVRRSGELAELEWCVADACDAVAAEISAVQNISHARAVGQVQFACALHHLIKTFITGVGGWTEQQLPDGTVILTAPTGHIYTTDAHGAAMFPALAQPTGELPIPPTLQMPDTDRSAMMPPRPACRQAGRRCGAACVETLPWATP